MARNTGLLIGGKSVVGVLSLAYAALAVRALGIEAFGQLILIHTFVQAVSELVKFETWQPILRYGTPAIHENRIGDLQRLIKFSLVLDVASSVLGTGIAALGIYVFGGLIGLTSQTTPMALFYSLSILFMVTATPTGVLRLFDRFDQLAVQGSMSAVVRIVGATALFVMGDGNLADFLLVWMASAVASGLAGMVLTWREIHRRSLWQGASSSWRGLTHGFDDIWKFVWANNANSAVSLLQSHVGTLLVGAMLGPTQAGLYRVARQLAEALAKPVKLLTSAVYPEMARFVADRRTDLIRRFIGKALAVSGLISVVTMALLALVGVYLLRLIGGGQMDSAYQVMLLLGGASLIGMWTFPLEPALISLGRATTALWVRIAAAIAYIPLLFLLTRSHGMEGAGIAALAAALVAAGGQLFFVLSWFRETAASGDFRASPPPSV